MEQLIVAVFLVLFALEFAVEFLLNEWNLSYVRARWADKSIPAYFDGKISPIEYEKSVHYTIAKGGFARWDEIYGRIVALAVLFSGLLGWLDQFATALAQQFSLGRYGQGIIFCLSVGLIFSIAGLPTGLYSTLCLVA